MRDVLLEVFNRQTAGETVVLARVVAMHGFGGRRAGEAMHVGADSVSGHLAMGAADEHVVVAARELMSTNQPTRLITVPVGDDEAVRAGLACGGSVEILLQVSSTIPTALLAAVQSGVDVMLVTELSTGVSVVVDGRSEPSIATVQATVPVSVSANVSEAVNQAHRMLAKGPRTVLIGDGDERVLIDPILSTPQLHVLGLAELSEAIRSLGKLLGWTVSVVDESAVGALIAAAKLLGPNDGVVVLSHDVPASSAVLAAALTGNCGYVGALGSRHTQQARAAELSTVHHLEAEVIARVRGPVGLDLGSRTPEETAVAIAAEMLAIVRGRGATSLAQVNGPING
jgi:xanthine dehydrogenase accessory factor